MFVDIVPVRSESRATFTRRPDALELALAGDRLAGAVPFPAGKPAEPGSYTPLPPPPNELA